MPDVNFTSYADQVGISVSNLQVVPADPSSYDDTLKISHCISCSFTGGVVVGGRENALDLNRKCEDVTVSLLELHGGRQASIVCKGGCRGVVLRDMVISPDPKSWTDILWDDWSAQSTDPSSGVLDNVVRHDGKPVRIVFGRFRLPLVLRSKVRVLWIYSIGLHLYNLGKDLAVALRLCRP